MRGRITAGIHVLGVDDGPFARTHRGDVPVAGVVFRGGTTFDGLLVTRIRRDGWNATDRLVAMIRGSKFAPHLACLLLDGIALGGFNVVDLWALHRATGLGVAAVMRRPPDLDAVRRAVMRLPGGERRWARILAAGPILPAGRVLVQLAGLTPREADHLVRLTATRSHLPEPLRAAHLIAGALVTGQSGRRA